jgi:hypothetical protein
MLQVDSSAKVVPQLLCKNKLYAMRGSCDLKSFTSVGKRGTDPDWIIILSVIYLDAFRAEKIGGIILQAHFNGRSQFGKLGFETFQSHLEASNNIFGGRKFPSLRTP